MINRRTLQKIRLTALILFIVAAGLYIGNKWMLYNQFDRSYPEISFDQQVLNVSVKATDEDLLKGVTATDGKDGDITDTLMIESISHMLDNNERIVTYVAFDKDNHVGKAQRKIRYTDYKPIRFSLDAPLGNVSGDASLQEILAPLHATDSIDGDITDQIILVDSYWTITNSGYDIATYTVQVTNSAGQVEDVTLSFREMKEENRYGSSVQIKLTDYLVYVEAGDESYSSRNYFDTIIMNGYEYGRDYLKVDSDVDVHTPGTYIVTFSATINGRTGMCDMIVIVEE